MTELTPAWITAQRWFRAKHREVAALEELERAPLVGPADLRVIEVRYADDGPSDRYLVPTVGGREPRDGEGAWTRLVIAMAEDAALRGRAGTFACSPGPALEELLPSAAIAAAALDERRLTVEQSNTSVVIGDRLILKLFRLLESGENPDLEIGAFLGEVGFADTPPLAGTIVYVPVEGEPAAVAMLQGLVDTTGDAWSLILGALATDPDEAVRGAERVGAVTAGLHAALASRPDDPSFPARPATVEEAASWRASAERQLAQAVGSLRGEAHDRLVRLAPAVRARFADTFGAASGEARVTRIHGDYHLGQLLARPDGGLSIIDFEGEPARPLAERRAPSSPLRDVAGMLRSLDYAARTAAARDGGFDPDRWMAMAREAFIDAYGGIGADDAPLLDAFELEKACYEVRYEASNRPEWLWLPLAAVERLAAPGTGG